MSQLAASAPSIEVATGADALDALDGGWDELLSRQSLPSPMLGSTWLRGVRRGDPGACVVRVCDGGRLVAGGAFRCSGRRPFRTATWLAGARFPGVLSDPADRGAALHVIAEVLDRCDLLWLPRAPVHDPVVSAVAGRAPWHRTTAVRPEGWKVPLPPPRLAHAEAKADYARRRAARKGADVRVRVAAGPDRVCAAHERLAGLYQRRWRGRERLGSRLSDVATATARYRALLPQLAREGGVRVVEVLEEGRLVASLLGLLAGPGALFHTTATDPGGVLRGPGHLAMLAWAKEAMGAGAQVMYLGRGAGQPEGPKARLGASPVELVDLLAAATPRRQRTAEKALAVSAPLRWIRLPGGTA